MLFLIASIFHRQIFLALVFLQMQRRHLKLLIHSSQIQLQTPK